MDLIQMDDYPADSCAKSSTAFLLMFSFLGNCEARFFCHYITLTQFFQVGNSIHTEVEIIILSVTLAETKDDGISKILFFFKP